MNEMPTKLKASAMRKSAKRDEKKRQIAASAIKALEELGYANTSLRDIAAKSDMSLGILHYYFEDRSDLIIYCVRVYKQRFVDGIISTLDDTSDREGVIDVLASALATSITQDAMTHRLWYDIRNQAMFDKTFRPVVAEIETMLISIVSRALECAGSDSSTKVDVLYALLDGVFRLLLQDQLGEPSYDFKKSKKVFKSILQKVL